MVLPGILQSSALIIIFWMGWRITQFFFFYFQVHFDLGPLSSPFGCSGEHSFLLTNPLNHPQRFDITKYLNKPMSFSDHKLGSHFVFFRQNTFRYLLSFIRMYIDVHRCDESLPSALPTGLGHCSKV
jgi:hypothetical protein